MLYVCIKHNICKNKKCALRYPVKLNHRFTRREVIKRRVLQQYKKVGKYETLFFCIGCPAKLFAAMPFRHVEVKKVRNK